MAAHRPRAGRAGTRPRDEGERTDIRHEVGFRLRQHRQRTGLSQTQVAAVVHVSLSAVSMWEQGHRELGYEKLLRLASLYGVSVGDFFHDAPTPVSAEISRLEARVAVLERALTTTKPAR